MIIGPSRQRIETLPTERPARPHASDVAQTSSIRLKPDVSLLTSASPRFFRGAWDDRIACSGGPSIPIVSSTRYPVIVRRVIIKKDSNTAAVAGHFEKCETKSILLRTEHAADKPLPFRRYPITPSILNDLEIIMCRYGLRREARHISANAAKPMLFRALDTFIADR
jgi:hypothetical protein